MGRPKKHDGGTRPVSVRVPVVLYGRLVKAAEDAKVSVADWAVDAFRLKLDDPLRGDLMSGTVYTVTPSPGDGVTTGTLKVATSPAGFGLSVEDFLAKQPPSVGLVADANRFLDSVDLEADRQIVSMATRSWSEVFAECRAQGEFGAELFAEKTAHVKKWPNGFKTWNERKQGEWLDENHPLEDEQ